MTHPTVLLRVFPGRCMAWCLPAIVAAFALAMPPSTRACSVPVFRYALEHWQADPYVAVVFHRGELNPDQQKLVDRLEPRGDTGNSIANLIVQTVDLDGDPGDELLDLYKTHETDTLPLLSLQTSPRLGPPRTAWSGPLTAHNVDGLIDSPIRSQLRKRLLAGDSVVWVYLERGEPQADDAAFALLQQELARLQQTIELPAIEEQDLAEMTLAPEELKLAFSALRLSRDNKAERPLIEMLLRVEPDLLDEPYVHQAMAFPVFGRGRALYALVGEGITAETIEDASRFLTGACQCTVKAQNPGVDLLMAVDWDQYVTPALPYDDSQPILSGLTSFAAPLPETDETAAGSAADTKTTAADSAVAAQETSAGGPSAVVPSAVTPSVTGDAATAASTDVPPAGAGAPAASTGRSASSADPTGVRSLTRNITLTLGLIVAGVVLATSVILLKSRR